MTPRAYSSGAGNANVETSNIVIKGSNTWQLHQPAEGPRRGQWLIFKYSQ